MTNVSNKKQICHGFVKKLGFEVGNGIEPFYVSPETTQQKLESQQVYLSLNGFVCEDISEDLCRCGFN